MIKKKKKKKVELPKKHLNEKAFGVILNDKGTYDMATIKFHPVTKQAFVEKVEKLADTYYRAVYELEKLLAYGVLVPDEDSKKEKKDVTGR